MGVAEGFFLSIRKLPQVLLERTAVMAVIAILFFAIGIFTGFRMQRTELILWSAVLALLILCRCLTLISTVGKYGYEVLEGKIEKVHDILFVNACTATLLLEDGSTTRLLLGKQGRFKTGKRYRFYFCRKCESAGGKVRKNDRTCKSLYLGFEEIGD